MPLLQTTGGGSSKAFGAPRDRKRYSGAAAPNTISNLYAWYDGDSLDSGASTWTDKSGNGRTVSISTGTRSKVLVGGSAGAAAAFNALQFNTSTDITWFPGLNFSNSSGWTFIHVARYNPAGSNQRIFHTSYANNWLSGFWSGNSGTQYHEGWLTGVQGSHPINNHGTNWVINVDQHNFLRSNGVLRGNSGNGTYNPTNGVRTNNSYEVSDGFIAEVMWFTRNLSQAEYQSIEFYLANKYGMELG